MATVIEGRIAFGTLVSDTGNSTFTLSAGLDPSVCVIEAAPINPFPPLIAPLVIEGTFGRTVFRDCALRSPQLSLGDSQRIAYTIVDRRWRWQEGGGIMRGRFNWRREQTTGTPWGTASTEPLENRRSPREIVIELLRLLGETDFDASQIPDIPTDQWPTFEFDHVPARLALGQVLDAVRCVLTLGVDDRVRIYRPGTGASIGRADHAHQEGYGINIKLRPDALYFIGSETKYEATFQTEPVGKDLDGSWKHIDRLSYKPKTGWEEADLEGVDVGIDFDPMATLPDYDKERSKAMAIALAQDTVFRCWRILPRFADGSTSLDDITLLRVDRLNLLDTLLGRSYDPVTSHRVERRPFVEGQFFDSQLFLGNSPAATRYRGGVSVDAENSLIVTADKMYRLDDSGKTKPALLFARLAFTYRHNDHCVPHRYLKLRRMPGATLGAGADGVRRDDVERRVFARFKSPPPAGGPYSLAGVNTNDAEVSRAADYYLDAAQREYIAVPQMTRVLIGLHGVEPSALVPQVSWATQNGIPTTTATEGGEHDLIVLPYRDRSRQERDRDMRRGEL